MGEAVERRASHTVTSLLDRTAHRPWPLPSGPWIMAQSWHDLLFAHWPVDAAMLRPHIPAKLEIDTFDGRAWLGIVPFSMSGVRLRWTPPLPGLSAFPEFNVRTDVTAQREAGGWIEYRSDRCHPGAPGSEFQGRYRGAGEFFEAQPGTLAHFLTERYCLYSATSKGRIYRGEIHHPPWLLQAAEAQITKNSMAEAAGLILHAEPPLLHFAKRQDMVAWAPDRIA